MKKIVTLLMILLLPAFLIPANVYADPKCGNGWKKNCSSDCDQRNYGYVDNNYYYDGKFKRVRSEAKKEIWEHPRIVAAVRELEDAIAYMKQSPQNFGGHKREAIESSVEAIKHLKKALEYRERSMKEYF